MNLNPPLPALDRFKPEAVITTFGFDADDLRGRKLCTAETLRSSHPHGGADRRALGL